MADTLKRLAILGSTGSIGQQTLEVVRAFPDRFRVVALAAGNNIEELGRQASEFKPRFVYHHTTAEPTDFGAQVVPLHEMATLAEVDVVLVSVSGDAGLEPTLAAAKAGKRIALANKESLVTAGEIITAAAEKSGAEIFPVDSEHSAIWQCLTGETSAPARLILTASGGPFRRYSRDQLDGVTPEQALDHPSWRMGKKVTIDSATLMNKGLEVIEAHWLFHMAIEQISIIVHPQSIIHSMVEFSDGAIKAQLGFPDMRLPIQYALSYPERLPNHGIPRLELSTLRELTLEPPDFTTFPCLGLAIEAGKKGGTFPAVLSAADTCAVELFLKGRIRFTDIARLVEAALSEHESTDRPSLEEVLDAATHARTRVKELVSGDGL